MSLACVLCLYVYIPHRRQLFFHNETLSIFAALMIWRRERPSLPLPVKLRKSPSLLVFFFLSFFFNIYVPRPASCLDGGCWCVSDPCRVRVLAVNMWESLFASDLFFVSFFLSPALCLQMTFDAVLLLFLNCNV